MKFVILNLNYLSVFGTAVAGFLLGWLWYSPVLFAKSWMAEMKITPEKIKAMKPAAMARMFALGFLYTLMSTFGLAVLLTVWGPVIWYRGSECGFFFGVFFLGARMLNSSLWEQRTLKLQAITIGHELALFTLQGTILALWN